MKKSKRPRKNPSMPLSHFLAQSTNNILATSKLLRKVPVLPEKVIELPTAPRANRPLDFEAIVPQTPPYVAFLNNLPFDADDQDVRNLFPEYKIKSLRLPREKPYQKRTRGFAYLEFEKRDDLITVLLTEEPFLRGRRIRIELSNEDDCYKPYLQRMNNTSLSDCTDSLPTYRFDNPYNSKDKVSPRSLGVVGGEGDTIECSSEAEATFDKEFPELSATPRKSPRKVPSSISASSSSSSKEEQGASGQKITASKQRIFGLATPVDTAKKEAEIEERLQQERLTQQRFQELAAYENANSHYRNFFGEIRPPKLHFFRDI